MKLSIKTMICNIKKQKQPIRTRRKMNKKMRIVTVNSLWDNFKRSNIHSIGVPEEERVKKLTLFEKIMKENFPNLVKELEWKSTKHRVPKKRVQRGPPQDTS